MDDRLHAVSRDLWERYGVTAAFTRRQEQVIKRLAEGRPVEEIAAELGITAGTVREHANRARLNAKIYEIRQQRGKR